MPLKLMYITNDPEVALVAEKNGVDRIWVDLETLGKAERQKNMDTVKNAHTVEDVRTLSKVLTKSELMVRINPWNVNSLKEIEDVLAAGAQIIMLPMWKSKAETDAFLEAVGGRAKTILLLETDKAVLCIDEVLKNKLVDEVHIGLNDLHLSYGMTFMFELLADGTVEKICKKLHAAGVPYGFGGIARIGEGVLPAEKIVIDHYRLGSCMTILSRSFCNANEIRDIEEIEHVFSENIKLLRDFEAEIPKLTEDDFRRNVETIKRCVQQIVRTIMETKNA